MTQPIPPNPPTPPPTPPTDSSSKASKAPPTSYGASTGKPMTFLGMHFTAEESEKLWYAIMEQVRSAIQQQQARALKALKKLRDSNSD